MGYAKAREGRLVASLRRRALERARADRAGYVDVRRLAQHSRSVHRWRLGTVLVSRRSVTGNVVCTEPDLDDLAGRELAAALGVTLHEAAGRVRTADLLATTLTGTAEALRLGRVDDRRVQVVVRAVDGLDEVAQRAVDARVVEQIRGATPWEDCVGRTFADRVRTAVAEVVTRRREELEEQVRAASHVWARVHPDQPALATLTVTGPTEVVLAVADALVVASARMDDEELAGRTRGQAAVDVLAGCVLGGSGPARVPARPVRRELGVLLHADALFDDGPARASAAQVRCGSGGEGLTWTDAGTARFLADSLVDAGAVTVLLLADDGGRLVRTLRVRTPDGGWTRELLVGAARREAARTVHVTQVPGYVPTAGIADEVRARDPRCTFPGCGVASSRCDLDHDEPWPRGPTSTANLTPRSRRCHRYKTVGLWRSRTVLDHCGRVVAHRWTSPLGTEQVVEVPRLPGC